MSLTLNQFSKLLVDYINTNFIPILRLEYILYDKVIEKWEEIEKIILQKEIEHCTFDSIEKIFKKQSKTQDIGKNHNKQREQKRHSTQILKSEEQKIEKYNKTYDNFFTDKNNTNNSYSYTPASVDLSSLKNQLEFQSTTKKQNNRPIFLAKNTPISSSYNPSTYSLQKQNSSKTQEETNLSENNQENYTKLINGFRKLCINFENNQKKLSRHDNSVNKNYSNFKENWEKPQGMIENSKF